MRHCALGSEEVVALKDSWVLDFPLKVLRAPPEMSKTLKKKKHWSTKVQECTLSWGGSGELVSVVEVRGGAELGEFPYLGHMALEAVVCHVGRFPSSGDVLLEVNGTPVSGLTNRDTLAVIRHFREPIRLKTVKPGEDAFISNTCRRP